MRKQLTIQFLVIILASTQPLYAQGVAKHWRRPAVRGAFNVDHYAYNKPMVNLVGQLAVESGPALPMDHLLKQLSHSSRIATSMQKSHYRNLDDGQTDNYMPRNRANMEAIEAEPEAVAGDEDEDEFVNSTANATANQIIAMPKRKQSDDYLRATIRTTTIATTTTEQAMNVVAAAAGAAPPALLAVNQQLTAQQTNSSLDNSQAREILYSHEFHVQNMGAKKIVLLNTLANGVGSKTDDDQAHKPVGPEVIATQTEPLNVKLALPALSLSESTEEQQHQVPNPANITATDNAMMNFSKPVATTVESTEAISAMETLLPAESLKQMEHSLKADGLQKEKLIDVTDDSDNRVNGTSPMTTNAMKSPEKIVAANASGKDKGHEHHPKQQEQESNANVKQSTQQQAAIQLDKIVKNVAAVAGAAGAADADTKKSGKQPDNDGHVASATESKPEQETVDKPARLASKLKSRRKQTQIKTKKPNESDIKPTMVTTPSNRMQSLDSKRNSTDLLMVGTANVKAPLKESPEITPQQIHRPVQEVSQSGQAAQAAGSKGKGKGKGKPKRKGSQRHPTSGSEQEIETTTNWWHILPYAEIRKFLNTIYDSIANDEDDERAQRM